MTPPRSLVHTAVPMALVLLLVAPVARADPGRDGTDEPRALAVIDRAAAAGTLSYRGTQVVGVLTQSGPLTQVREVSRDAVGAGAGTGAAGGAAALAALVAGFELTSDGTGWVAGRLADVVVARRAGRVAGRLWIDRETGLALRRELLDPAGRTVRVWALVRIDVTGRTGLVPALVPPLGGEAAPVAVDADRLRRDGWPCRDDLPVGFRLVDARYTDAVRSTPAVHLTYTDGLSTLSVFLQPGRLEEAGLTGFRERVWGGLRIHSGDGWPVRLVWQDGDTVVTVVSDAPEETLREAVAAVPGRRAERDKGLLSALGRGLREVVELLPGL